MAQTTFTNGTVITSAWLNDVDQRIYGSAQAGAVVNSIAALKLLNKSTVTRAFVLGYYAAGDGGGGVYWYNSADTTGTDDGGSLIVANDGGRWYLQYTGRVSVKQFGATGDGSTVDLTAIQKAYTIFDDLFWPDGTYNLGANTWAPTNTSFQIHGESRRNVILTRTGSGPIITLPYGMEDPVIRNIYFTGSGNTGITVASTAGALQGYAIRPIIQECDFAYELSYGINADLIYARIEKCSFGDTGTVGGKPAPGASTMCAIRSVVYPATTNYTNLNIIRDCVINCGGLTTGALQLSGGNVWKYENTDFSNGGVAVDASDISNHEFDHCWFENNTATNGIVLLSGTSVNYTTFRQCNFSNNTITNNRLVQWSSTIPNRISFERNTFGLNFGCYIIYDNPTLSNTLNGAGYITFFDNVVSGGSGTNRLQTWTDFRGGQSARFSIIVDTTGSGSILSCSDPNATLSRTGTGDVTVSNISNPLASANNKVNVQVTGLGASQFRATTVTTTSFRLQGFNTSGTAVDGVLCVVVTGS